MQPLDALWGVASGLGAIVLKQFNDRHGALEKRVADLESTNKDRAVDDRALRDAVVKLTVTVELLAKQVEALAERNT